MPKCLSRPFRSDHQLVEIAWISTRALVFRLVEWVRVLFRYYRKPTFALRDLALLSHYLFANPHRIGRKWGTLYGETPLTTLERIAKECRLLSHDVVYELGCGTGRTCLWLRHFVTCQVVGIDQVSIFIRRAKRLTRRGLTFIAGDVTQSALTDATVIYLYGTGWSEEVMRLLCDRFATLPAGIKIITVSAALSDYDSRFCVGKQFEGHFPWGKAPIFLNYIISPLRRETFGACRE